MIVQAQIKKDEPWGIVPAVDPSFLRFIQENDGKKAWLQVHLNRPKRSNQQNAYYWGVPVKIISDYTGYDPEDVHELNKAMFLEKKRLLLGDKSPWEWEIVGSSRKLNTVEFNEFIERIIRYWAENHDVQIPLPNEAPGYAQFNSQ